MLKQPAVWPWCALAEPPCWICRLAPRPHKLLIASLKEPWHSLLRPQSVRILALSMFVRVVPCASSITASNLGMGSPLPFGGCRELALPRSTSSPHLDSRLWLIWWFWFHLQKKMFWLAAMCPNASFRLQASEACPMPPRQVPGGLALPVTWLKGGTG